MIFSDFDFSLLDNPEFQEDAVREELIAPLLKSLGYSASGEYKIIRSRKLLHPYVMFGSQKRKVNIVPDYILEVEGKPALVLDAKGPAEDIEVGDNVAQVYSYAIHPEVRSNVFALCNGRRLALFSIFAHSPKRVYDLAALSQSDLLDLTQKLSPQSLTSAAVLDFDIDGGLFLFMNGVTNETELSFLDVAIPFIGTMDRDSYAINSATSSFTDRNILLTFDFNRAQLDNLLKIVGPEVAANIQKSLDKVPFHYHNDCDPPKVSICLSKSQTHSERS